MLVVFAGRVFPVTFCVHSVGFHISLISQCKQAWCFTLALAAVDCSALHNSLQFCHLSVDNKLSFTRHLFPGCMSVGILPTDRWHMGIVDSACLTGGCNTLCYKFTRDFSILWQITELAALSLSENNWITDAGTATSDLPCMCSYCV